MFSRTRVKYLGMGSVGHSLQNMSLTGSTLGHSATEQWVINVHDSNFRINMVRSGVI